MFRQQEVGISAEEVAIWTHPLNPGATLPTSHRPAHRPPIETPVGFRVMVCTAGSSQCCTRRESVCPFLPPQSLLFLFSHIPAQLESISRFGPHREAESPKRKTAIILHCTDRGHRGINTHCSATCSWTKVSAFRQTMPAGQAPVPVKNLTYRRSFRRASLLQRLYSAGHQTSSGAQLSRIRAPVNLHQSLKGAASLI